MNASDEFYVGYLPGVPAGMRRRTRHAVSAFVSAALVVALAISLALEPVGPANFEFGQRRAFTGQLVERPHPTLRVPRPGIDGGFSRYLLVGAWKHGASHEVTGLDGRWVTLAGSLVHRDDRTMIEVAAGSVQALAAPPTGPAAATIPGSQIETPESVAADGALEPSRPVTEILGPVTLRGEIVDSKCFLGVMNPGSTKVHRDCAARCISGGIPPVLLVRDGQGRSACLMLAGPDGRMVGAEVLTMIAEPVEVTGTVERHDDLLVLRADPSSFRRLADG